MFPPRLHLDDTASLPSLSPDISRLNFEMSSNRESRFPTSNCSHGVRQISPSFQSTSIVQQDLSLNSEETLGSDRGGENFVDSSNLEDVASPRAPGPIQKETREQGQNLPAVEESVEERINRLGRQRPEVFTSMWAEIGFVFSISMSQVISVRLLSVSQLNVPDKSTGILCVRIYCNSANSSKGFRYPSSIFHMACKRFFAHVGKLSARLRKDG